MPRVKLKPYERRHSIANVFLPFLDYLESLQHVQQVGYRGFTWRGNHNRSGYEVKSYHPDKHSIQVIAHCREGTQEFFVRVEPYESRVISEVTRFIESY